MQSLLQILGLFTLSLSLCVSGVSVPESESEPALVKRDNAFGLDGYGWAVTYSLDFVYIMATQGTS